MDVEISTYQEENADFTVGLFLAFRSFLLISRLSRRLKTLSRIKRQSEPRCNNLHDHRRWGLKTDSSRVDSWIELLSIKNSKGGEGRGRNWRDRADGNRRTVSKKR